MIRKEIAVVLIVGGELIVRVGIVRVSNVRVSNVRVVFRHIVGKHVSYDTFSFHLVEWKVVVCQLISVFVYSHNYDLYHCLIVNGF